MTGSVRGGGRVTRGRAGVAPGSVASQRGLMPWSPSIARGPLRPVNAGTLLPANALALSTVSGAPPVIVTIHADGHHDHSSDAWIGYGEQTADYRKCVCHGEGFVAFEGLW